MILLALWQSQFVSIWYYLRTIIFICLFVCVYRVIYTYIYLCGWYYLQDQIKDEEPTFIPIQLGTFQHPKRPYNQSQRKW